MNRKHDIVAACFVGAILFAIIVLLIVVIGRMIHEPRLHNFLILVSLFLNGGLMSYFFFSIIRDLRNYPHYFE